MKPALLLSLLLLSGCATNWRAMHPKKYEAPHHNVRYVPRKY